MRTMPEPTRVPKCVIRRPYFLVQTWVLAAAGHAGVVLGGSAHSALHPFGTRRFPGIRTQPRCL